MVDHLLCCDVIGGVCVVQIIMELLPSRNIEISETMDLGEDLERLVNSLFSFTVLYMANDQPDISVLECEHDYQVHLLCQELFGKDKIYQQLIVNNMCPETNGRCPFFRVMMTDFDTSTPINYKLQTFFNRIRMPSLSSRCLKAIVVGLSNLSNIDHALSIPFCFRTTDIEPLLLSGEIDLACTKVTGVGAHPPGFTLADIAGLSLPVHVPPEVQSCILSYCREPTAQLIVDQMDLLLERWDAILHPMFMQREPRIPVHLASFYNAATVARSIQDATRSFLARPAKQ